MTLPYIFAGTCITFVLICIIAHYANNKDRKKTSSAPHSRAEQIPFAFPSQLRTELYNKLRSKNFNPLIVNILETSELGAKYSISNTQRALNITFSDAGKIADQLEMLHFITPYENNARLWSVSRNNPNYIIQLIDEANPYPL